MKKNPYILGISGSPHPHGKTSQLVSVCLEGAKEVGAKTEFISLSTVKILPCQDCAKNTCWVDGKCNYDDKDDRKKLQEKLNLCDGLIVGAPVYFFDVNGITKNFFDRMRGIDIDGKPALGIAVAGGTGKGLILALKTIYYFFLCIGFRGIEPLPVTRFNFRSSLISAKEIGRKLAGLSGRPQRFRGLADKLYFNYSTKFMNYSVIDENLYLLELILKNIQETPDNKKMLSEAKEIHQEALKLLEKGEKEKATREIINGYERAVKAWEISNR